MKEMIKYYVNKYYKILNLIIIVGLLIYILGQGCARTRNVHLEEEVKIEMKYDTITINNPLHDTVYLTKHVPHYLEVVSIDTVTVKDSVLVYIPIKEYVFEEPNKYKINVSGFDVQMNSIEVYPKTVTICETKTIKTKPRWGLGIQVGVGAGYKSTSPHIQFSPYIGIGINYNIITF